MPMMAYHHGMTNELHDYDTAEMIRPATRAEWEASVEAARHDGGAGVIEVDGRRCYVTGEQWNPPTFADSVAELFAADCADTTERLSEFLAGVEAWNDRTARLFAADCAERVLPLFERDYLGDDRPRRAIAMARAFARGEADRDDSLDAYAAWLGVWANDREEASDAAFDAALAAAWEQTASVAARDAASAAASAAGWDAAIAAKAVAASNGASATAANAAWTAAFGAASAAERAWQTERLVAYVTGAVQA